MVGQESDADETGEEWLVDVQAQQEVPSRRTRVDDVRLVRLIRRSVVRSPQRVPGRGLLQHCAAILTLPQPPHTQISGAARHAV